MESEWDIETQESGVIRSAWSVCAPVPARLCRHYRHPLDVSGHRDQYLGPNRLLWATDYPHVDGYFPGAPQMIANRLPEGIRREVLAQGAVDFYKLN